MSTATHRIVGGLGGLVIGPVDLAPMAETFSEKVDERPVLQQPAIVPADVDPLTAYGRADQAWGERTHPHRQLARLQETCLPPLSRGVPAAELAKVLIEEFPTKIWPCYVLGGDPVTIRWQESLKSVHGTVYRTKEEGWVVVVKPRPKDPVGMFETLLHECAHARLGHILLSNKPPTWVTPAQAAAPVNESALLRAVGPPRGGDLDVEIEEHVLLHEREAYAWSAAELYWWLGVDRPVRLR